MTRASKPTTPTAPALVAAMVPTLMGWDACVGLGVGSGMGTGVVLGLGEAVVLVGGREEVVLV